MIVNLSCKRTLRSAPEVLDADLDLYSKIEQIKLENRTQKDDYKYNVTINVMNDSETNIRNIRFTIHLLSKELREENEYFFKENEISSNNSLTRILFDASGLKQVSIRIMDVEYYDNMGNKHNSISGNFPYLIDIGAFKNPYFGCRNQTEMRVRMLLRSYLGTDFCLVNCELNAYINRKYGSASNSVSSLLNFLFVFFRIL